VSCPDDTGPCTTAPVPAALQPLVNLRNAQHADLMSIVRIFNEPENDSCGIAWLIGGGQIPIENEDSYAGVSVISDSNGVGGPFGDDGYYCRDETFAHEVAHNMGAAHDVETSRGTDGTLTADEYGRFPYSFGYRTATFYTVMAYGQEIPGQRQARVFSNPRLSAPCFGTPCGLADQADNARGLGQTVPIVAAFFASLHAGVPTADFDADGRSDVLWRNLASGQNAVWRAASSASSYNITAIADQNWKVAGLGDFDGDGRSDILWRNSASGQNSLWRAASSSLPTTLTPIADQGWKVAGVGDFNGDDRSDILWRHSTTGANSIWFSANSATRQNLTTVAGGWIVAAVGDYDGDNRADILWRRASTGTNSIWRSGNSATSIAVTGTASAWFVAGSGDFNGDGRDDVLWRHSASGQNAIWRSGSSASPQAVTTVASQSWRVALVADFNGDGRADILWRHSQTGGNTAWLSGSSASTLPITTVATSWQIAH
jgi:hypothetical protein